MVNGFLLTLNGKMEEYKCLNILIILEFILIIVDGPAEIQYKFSNGEPFMGTAFQDGKSYDFETDGCGSGNGIGGFNRTFTRSGENEFAGTFCYNTCGNCNSIDLGNNVSSNNSFTFS